MDNKIKLFVLNNFLRFEKKVYHLFGIKLTRPIQFKTFIYAFVFGVIELILYFTPVLGIFVRWMPFVFLIGIPFLLAWLLQDVGTEGRQPASFFRSFVQYYIRKFQGDSYYRNRSVQKNQDYSFVNFFTFKEREVFPEEIELENQAYLEQRKALRYLHRIHYPDDFYQKQQEMLETRKGRKKKKQQQKQKKSRSKTNISSKKGEKKKVSKKGA